MQEIARTVILKSHTDNRTLFDHEKKVYIPEASRRFKEITDWEKIKKEVKRAK